MGWPYQGPVRIGLVLILAVFATNARECKISCIEGLENQLRFEPGKVYNYELEGQSITRLGGALEDVSRLAIHADVQISVLSNCEHALKITNVQTTGTDNKKHSLETLSQQPIKFGLGNGHIDSEICANDAEDNVALNIKRAVLSMIQSSIIRDSGYGTHTETDIFGECPTGFEFSKSGGTITVIKNRDLNKCAHREDITIPFLSTPYYAKSDIQSSSLLASSLRSEQKIDGGLLKSASLEEIYQYGPGVAESEAKITIRTKLNHVNTAAGAIPASCNIPRSIIFEKEHPQEGVGISNKIVDLVRQGCESRSVGQDTAQKFSQLVRTVAAASKQDILAALQHVKSGPGIKDRVGAKRILLDAILMAQSASSVEIMADILKRKEITGNDARMWLLGLGAVKHASRPALLAVLPLLDGEPDVNAYLGIGSLAGKFCREHTCEGVNEVNQLQIKLGAPLLKGCQVNTKREEDQLIASLKGLGNIKYLGSKIAGKIIECVQNEKVRPRIRVAALETIATDPNKEQFKITSLKILQNVNEDSEIRIKAYQALVKCPCGKVAMAIKEVLEEEQSNQVGGYIVSHLRNLHASTNPDKAAARHHLGSIIPPRRFAIDPRRYSVNQEFSYAADIINTGASGEADVIYSQNSFLPRSVSVNLTTQLFGTAYNLLQVDARQENLQRLAESLLGPRGYLQTNEVEDYVMDGKNVLSRILERIATRYDKTLRPKRSISRDQLDTIANKVQLPVSSDELELDLSLKVLGNEMAWTHLHGSEVAKMRPENVIDGYFNRLDSFIQSLKNADVDYRRHITFIDREITYPTSMGLPLQLKTHGTAAVRLHVDGKIDLPAILRDPENTDIRFQLEPSAAINVNGEIAIDAVAFQSGVKIDLNIHTSTGSDVTFRLLNGRGVDLKLGLPLPKQDIISVKTEVNSIVRNQDQSTAVTPVKFDLIRETYSGCFDQLSGVIGLTFCGHVTIPSEKRPVYPMFIPIDLGLSIDKEDKSLTVYHLKALYDHREDTEVHSAEFLVDTPNTKIPRTIKIQAEGSLYGPEQFLKIKTINPLLIPEIVNLEANVVTTQNERSINAKLTVDEDEYTARIGAKSSRSGNKVTFEPILEYKAPEPTKGSNLIGKKGGSKKQGQVLSSAGSLIVEKSPNQEKYTFQGLGINTPRTSYLVDGTLVFEPNGGTCDLKVSYDNHHVNIKGKGKYSKNDIHSQLEISPSEFPDLGIGVTLDSSFDDLKGNYDNKLIVVHGPDPKSEFSRISILAKFESSPQPPQSILRPLSFLYEIKYPVIQLDAAFHGKVTPNSIASGIRGKLDKYSVKLEGAIEGNSKKDGSDIQATLDYELMGNEIRIISSRHVSGDTHRINNILILKPGGTYQTNAVVVTRLISSEDYLLSIDADVTTPDKSAVKLLASAQRNGPACQSNLKLTVADKTLISGSTQMNGGSAPNGVYSLSLPGHLESDGKLTSDGTVTKANAKLHLPKADRRMEASAEVTTKAPRYSGLLTISLDANNPSNTIKIQTDNAVSANNDAYSLDTRNTLSLGNDAVQINGKARRSGTELHGSLSSEVEVTLPCGNVVGGKFSKNTNLEGDNREAETAAEVFHHPKDGKVNKLTFRASGKHLDAEAGTIDGNVAIGFLHDDKDAIAHLALKKLPTSGGKTSNINGEIGVDGGLVPYPALLKWESEISNEYFEDDDSSSMETELPLIAYKYTCTVGKEIRVEGKGKLKGKVIANEVSGTLPSESEIRNFKIVSNNVVDIDDELEGAKVKLDNSLQWNDNRHVNTLIQGEVKERGVEGVLQYETDSTSKRRLSGSAHYSADNGFRGDASLAINYDDKSADISVKGEVNREQTESNLHIIISAPQLIEGDKADIVIKNKLVKSGRGLRTDLTVTSNNVKRTALANIDLDEDHPLLELTYDHPSGKSQIYYKGDRKSERHYASEVRVKWMANGGGSISMDNDMNLESVDNFQIKNSIETTLSETKKTYIEVSNKPGKGENKKITFLVKTNDQVLLSGSTNYNFKEEGDLAVLEGTGNLKYKEESYPLTLHAMRQRLENGYLGKLDVKSGKFALNVEHKVTPEEYSFQRTVCKEPKSCSKGQITSRVKSGPNGEEQTIIVLLDFSLLDPQLNDFSFKSVYKRDNLLLDHSAEIQLSPSSRIKSHAYIRDSSSGLYITLPKRTIGGETKYDVKKRDNGYTLRLETDLYINKEKEPKLCFIAATTTLYDKGVATIAGEMKVTHPSLGKDLVARSQLAVSEKPQRLVDGSLEIDVSPNANNKIIGSLKVSGAKDNVHTVATLKSKGCKIDLHYDEKIKVILNGQDSSYLYSEQVTWTDASNHKHEYLFKFEASKKKAQGQLKLPHVILEGEFTMDKGYSGNANIFGRKYSDNLVINRDSNSLKYELNGLEGGKVLTIEAGAKLGGSGVVRAALNNKNACSLDVALDSNNFLKSQYSYDTEVLKSIYGTLTNEINLLSNQCSKSIQSIADKQIVLAKQFLECVSKAKPDLSGVEKYVDGQLRQLRDELRSDKAVQDALDLIERLSGTLGGQIAAVIEELLKFAKTLNQIVDEAIKALQNALDEIRPKVQQSLERISKVLNNLLEQYLKLSRDLVNLALDRLKDHEADIKAIAQSIGEFLQDIGKVIGDTVVTLHQQLDELIRQSLDQAGDVPIIAAIQEKLQELKQLKVPDEVISLLHEVVEQVKQLLPTNEATQFVSTATEILEKLLRNEEIKNKDEAFRQLYREFIAAVKSLVALVAQNAPQSGLLKPMPIKQIPLINILRGAGTGGLRVSVLNLLSSEAFLPSLRELLSGLTISLNPLEYIPPFTGHGLVIGGSEIITFDGLHLGVPGACSYILAEDYKDRNFSIVGQIGNGALKSLTLSTGQGTIELSANGNTLVNGKPSALPAFAGDIKAWRKPGSVGAWFTAGVLILCTERLEICSIEVNGYYAGRVRGLLGNLNGEKFDDRLTPEGKIGEQASDLANAWKLDPSCSVPTIAGHIHTRNSKCTSLFTDDPVVLLCRPFVNPAPYRDACDHLARSKGSCFAMQAYVHHCRSHGVLIAEVPNSCASCTINGKTVEVGETENVGPGNAADIVIATELFEDNIQNYKQIAHPLVAALRSELGKAGINDVRVFIVGGPTASNPYPSFFTDEQGSWTYGPALNEHSFDKRPVDSNETLIERLRMAGNFIRKETGGGPVNRLYKTVLDNPLVFRPNAHRVILGVHGQRCPPLLPGVLVQSIMRMVDMDIQGIQYNVIVPFQKGVEKDGKEVTVAVLAENDAILPSGESIQETSYEESDPCIISATQSDGVAISADLVNASPRRAELIQEAAAKIVSTLKSRTIVFQCYCELWQGILPNPECYV